MSERIIPHTAGLDLPRWQFPGFDPPPPEPEPEPEPAPVVEPEPEPEPPLPLPRLPTLEEIEAIERAAREEGYAAGHAEGRDAGYVEGRAAGYAEGIVAGREAGHAAGHAAGLEDGHREGLTAGHGEGLVLGHREGMAAAAGELEARRQLLDAGLAELSAPLAALEPALEQELLALVVAIARQLVRRELKTSPGEIVATIRATVPLLPLAERRVALHVHPDDATLLREHGALAEGWQLVEDAALSRGGCRLEAGHSRIDATVETRLNAAIAALLGGEREEDRS